MVNNIHLFQNIIPIQQYNKYVTLADGKSKTKVLGIGSISGTLSGGTTITINDCIYVPGLSDSLLSTKNCSRQQSFSIFTENAQTIIATPDQMSYSDDPTNDSLIDFYVTPNPTVANKVASNRNRNLLSQHPCTSSEELQPTSTTTAINPPISEEEKSDMIKPKPTLPHWFKSNSKVVFKTKNDSIFHRGVLSRKSPFLWTLTYKLSNRKTNTINIQSDELLQLYESKRLMFGHKNLITKQEDINNSNSISSTESEPSLPTPSLQVHDKPISSLLQDVSFTID